MVASDHSFLFYFQIPHVIEELSRTESQADADDVLIRFNTVWYQYGP